MKTKTTITFEFDTPALAHIWAVRAERAGLMDADGNAVEPPAETPALKADAKPVAKETKPKKEPIKPKFSDRNIRGHIISCYMKGWKPSDIHDSVQANFGIKCRLGTVKAIWLGETFSKEYNALVKEHTKNPSKDWFGAWKLEAKKGEKS